MDDKMKEYLKGTTTVGLVCKDGVVFASDRRSTMGYLIADKEAQKIWQIDRHIGVTTAGGVGDNMTLVRLLKAEAALYRVNYKPITIEAMTTLLSNILNQMRMFPMLTQMIVGGYDNAPHIFEIDMVGGMCPKKFSSTGSGSPVAYGVLEDGYKESLDLDAGKKLAVKALKSALARDAGTGNGIDVVTITRSGYKQLSEDELNQLSR